MAKMQYGVKPDIFKITTNSSIVKLYATRTTTKTSTMQLKLSRFTEDDERSALVVLRNRVKPSKHPQRKVLTSIDEEIDSQVLRFLLEKRHTHRGLESELVRNPRVLSAE